MNTFRKVLALVGSFVAAIAMSVSPMTVEAFNDVPAGNVFEGYIDYLAEQGVINGNNPTFNPANKLSRAEAAKVFKNAAGLENNVDCAHKFNDVAADNEFYVYIQTLVCEGIISENDNYNPFAQITRAEFVKIAVGAFNLDTENPGMAVFSDVPADNPFFSFVQAAKREGLIGGYSDGSFGPNNPILRQEMAKVIANAHGYEGSPVQNGIAGEAVAIEMSVSAPEVVVGDAAVVTARVVDENGLTVTDYNGVIKFEKDSNCAVFGDKEMNASNGMAETTLTAYFGCVVEVYASASDFGYANVSQGSKVAVSFILDNNRRFVVRAAAQVLAPGESVLLYATGS